jgi:plasmid stabilization system protein ParE
MSRALQDLDGIYAYIAKTLMEPGTALKLVETIESEISRLNHAVPLPGKADRAYAKKGYRQLFIKNYTAVFRVDEKAKTVIIVTVRYSPSQF